MKNYLKAVYDPTITYGVGSHPLGEAIIGEDVEPDEAFYNQLESLTTRVFTGHDATAVRDTLYTNYGMYAHWVFNRSLDAGISVKTINKVLGNIIPVFQVMKAKNYEGQKLKYPLIAEIKADGLNHTIVVGDNNEVTYFTSGGKYFKLVDNGIFNSVPSGVYFAELIGTNGKLGDRQNCGIATTLRTNTAKGIANEAKLKWKVFDVVSHEDFARGYTKTNHHIRHSTIHERFGIDSLPESWWVSSDKQLEELMDAVVKGGYEGLVLKQNDMKWNNSGKRTAAMYKYKRLATYDLRVTDVEYGEGRLEGMIGSLLLADGSGKFVGKVGTGLTDADRLLPDAYYIGKVVEVKCERISPDGMLVQPVFLTFREEKELDVLS